jgi:hypothetical protein
MAVVDQDHSGKPSVVGFLRNELLEGVTNIRIRVRLIDEGGNVINQEEETLLIKHLLPGESAPFLIQFSEVGQTDRIDAEVLHYQRSGYRDAELNVEISGTVFNSEVKTIMLGWISNPLETPVEIHSIMFTAFDTDGTPQALVEPFHPSSLLPGERVPFLASFDGDLQASSFQSHTDATHLSVLKPPPVSFQQGPEVVFDPQGNLLVRGMIQNEGRLTRRISGSLALMLNDRIVSIAPFTPSIPLRPGEDRAFGLTAFPGWRERLQELEGGIDELEASIFLDPLASTEFMGQILQLRCEVTGFESTGSSLLLHGTVHNLTRSTVDVPTVQAEVRSTEGLLHTAGWVTIAQSLELDQSSPFVLVLRLPDGIELSQSEIDVYASGILEEIGLPF